MRISYKWLQKYINLDTSPEIVADKLTSVGLEVESIDYLGKKFDGFVVGKIVSKQKHPNADRLSVCLVKVSKKSEPHQIVCGAPNVAEGQKVIVALPGSIIPQNQHDPSSTPFQLNKAVIRGIESNGMICSEFELGIGVDKGGIKVLDGNIEVGTSLASYLGIDDVAFELGITPNRPDALCHLGVARDLGAAYQKKIKYPEINSAVNKTKKQAVDQSITVKVENRADCPRYSVRIITDIRIDESPAWLKKYLTAAGLRCINNVVDITNFVMLEYGQPLHAFDYDKLAGRSIVVKNSSPGEKFSTLDGKEHLLTGSELMICDAVQSIAIAGVMGGSNSEISSETKTVALESAYFNSVSIRRTSKRLGISTDASFRFERGTDPNVVHTASARAAFLIAELGGGKVLNGIKDFYPNEILPKKIFFRANKVGEVLGVDIPRKTSKSILTSLGMKFSNAKKKDTYYCFVPTNRPDIEQEIDLIEEVARIYGYDNIPDQLSGGVVFGTPSKTEKLLTSVGNWFEANGFNEIISNSLLAKDASFAEQSSVVSIKNPLSADHVVLRPSMLSTMLQSVEYNFNHGSERVQIFEMGKTFLKSGEKYPADYVDGVYEQNTLGICITGNANPLSWTAKTRKVDIYDIKGIVESLLNHLGLDNIHLICYDAPDSLTESALRIEINDTYVGSIGRCRKSILEKFKIEEDVFYSEISVDALLRFDTKKRYSGFSKYPTVKRDVAFIVNQEIQVGDIEEVIRNSGGSLLTDVIVFDVFSGKNVGDGKKSLAFSLQINSPEKTLTDSEIDSIVTNITQSVTSTFAAILRSN